ncbi:hypothetical protein [Niallia taxi]|uniref:hypothetical protein n=1 Tax=Niallia taxi TaxID=2499688 RepID=UPI00300840F8
MGCDIHMFLEVRKYPYQDEKRENGIWISKDKWSIEPDHYLCPEDNYKKYRVDYDDLIYKGRNYYLFSVLANVRNYNSFDYISEPKGLPNDVSSEIKDESDHWGSDGHSHSYLTLRELLSYNWNKEIIAHDLYGTEEKAKAELGDKIISSYPNGVFGFKVEYKESIGETMLDFLETIESMKKHLYSSDKEYWRVTEDDIRLVFWFDN